MEIKSAEFVISNTNVKKCPAGDLPEYAFIGRSNVGKSSLINMLTGKKGLAMTSQKPGKTMLINHFLINGQWYLVDLPGYGFAQRGKEGRENIQRIIEDYILEREQLTCLFVLIDCRHDPQKIDLEFGMAWRKRHSLFSHLHKDRQNQQRPPAGKPENLPDEAVGIMGRTSSHPPLLFRKERRKG